MPRLPRLVAIALLIAPLAARAQVAPAPAAAPARIDRPGFDLGLRLSYALPMGTVDGNDKLSDGVSSLIPLQVDALYRMNGQYAIGGYASYGFSFMCRRAARFRVLIVPSGTPRSAAIWLCDISWK